MIESSHHSYDTIYSTKYGKEFTITNKKLGAGSYGVVYISKDELGNKIAVKCCNNIPDVGIDNLFECALMCCLNHPYLNSAIDIVSTKFAVYIIQPLARFDLHQFTNKKNYAHQCTQEELRLWFHQLTQAVHVLHSLDIIHGDIKASNVLLYQDHVKLTDFTLSLKILGNQPDRQERLLIATNTHRPLEVFLKQDYDKSADIWSLGITFYEIFTNELLIRNQGVPDDDHEHKFMNAILDWAELTHQSLPIDKFEVQYLPVRIAPRFELPEFKWCADLIYKILRIKPSERPTTHDLLSEKLFENLECCSPTVVSPISNKLEMSEQARVIRYIQLMTTDDYLQHLIYQIYTKVNLSELTEHQLVICITWMVFKMLRLDCKFLTDMTSIEELTKWELLICHNLGFMIYPF